MPRFLVMDDSGVHAVLHQGAHAIDLASAHLARSWDTLSQIDYDTMQQAASQAQAGIERMPAHALAPLAAGLSLLLLVRLYVCCSARMRARAHHRMHCKSIKHE